MSDVSIIGKNEKLITLVGFFAFSEFPIVWLLL